LDRYSAIKPAAMLQDGEASALKTLTELSAPESRK